MFESYKKIDELWKEEEKACESGDKELQERVKEEKIKAIAENDKLFLKHLESGSFTLKTRIPFEYLTTIKVLINRLDSAWKFHNPKSGYLEWKSDVPEYVKTFIDSYYNVSKKSS